MLAVGDARDLENGGADHGAAGTQPSARKQRQIIAPIPPDHPHPAAPYRYGTVDDMRHGHHASVAKREPRGDPMA